MSTIKSEWEDYITNIPSDLDEEAVKAAKRIYYSGVATGIGVVMGKAIRNPGDNNDIGFIRDKDLISVLDELVAHREELREEIEHDEKHHV